jgi:steroid delta-isomerase-like uncharacterized protein
VDHKQLLRRYLEDIWQHRRLDALDDYIAADYVQHGKHAAPGREGLRRFFALLDVAFTNMRYSIDDVIADGDRVCWRFTIHAVHAGEFLGTPASGKHVTMTGISIFRVENGKFVEHWGEQDMLGFLQQVKP